MATPFQKQGPERRPLPAPRRPQPAPTPEGRPGRVEAATPAPPRRAARLLRLWLYPFTVFWSAYLLFQLEPLIGKFILPWFGGSPAVWTTCMLFFQTVLLAGYGYAHLSLRRLTPAHQAIIHLVLLLAAAAMLPITPAARWKPEDPTQPTLYILILLLGSVGLPYFALAATGPLLQAWFARRCPERSPYPLYALSNLGSLSALLSYPFLFEPYFKLGQQTQGWSFGFALFVLVCAALAWDFRHHAPPRGEVQVRARDEGDRRLSDRVHPALLRFLWLALPSAASALLLAVTNQLCQDVASVPFLWIVPLSLYLVSFVLCFARRSWYVRSVFIPAAALGTFGLVTVLYQGAQVGLAWQVGIYSAGLFFACMTCHGELYRLRPEPERLTGYYLAIAAGGALGGAFVAVAAPLLFPLYFEFHLALLACCGLTLLALAQDPQASGRWRPLRPLFALGLVVLAGRLANHAYQTASAKTVVSRNFYGVLRVEERSPDDPAQRRRVLRHGAIDHGFQFLAPDRKNLPAAYYGPQSGIGLALDHYRRPAGRRIGVVGLGTGTLLAYGRPGDRFRVYEINPSVVRLAQEYFSYLRDSPAEHTIVVADARLALEREPPQDFDLLILDAFSGDAIPLHLLTAEALSLYLRHLRPGGLLAFNISNRHLDLGPVMAALAERGKLQLRIVHSPPSPDGVTLYATDWALLTGDPAFFAQSGIDATPGRQPPPAGRVLWTDDYSNLFRVLK
ncbi:spermidine synthase [Candidatus Methylocalor cossyra]|uniref:Spermidine synthase n=1 Tax=Candidatus Methylocalor cossyra TaxID=3108543 RepID=A0ABP1CC69_9GAMM